MSSTDSGYRGRFAPSPTGPLHFGSLCTAVASFLQARAHAGKWLIRIDDLDPTRCKPQYSNHILKTLEQFGLVWDEEVFYQSSRHAAYRSALAELEQRHYLYPCSCSRKDLQLRRLDKGIYDQHCLRHAPGSEQPTSLRIKLPTESISFTDGVQGVVQQDLKNQVGDFVLFRKDQVASYHLAVVLDDAEQRISDVLRGHDLLDSTYRQIFLQRILHLKTPNYAHIPVVIDAEGSKLSKQSYATDVSLSPVRETLVSALAHLNLDPPTDLSASDVDDILRWGIENWSMDKIKRQDSVLFHAH
ncbi:MAG: tRNA glutamyl-Q(34) synthetase GluQRS [Cycloclasticus sp.]